MALQSRFSMKTRYVFNSLKNNVLFSKLILGMSGSRILVRGGDKGVTARKAFPQGVAGGLQPLAGVQGQSRWGSGAKPQTKLPKFFTFFN